MVLTFKERGLKAVMQVLFAVKASLSRVVYATIVRVPYCVKPQGTGSIPPPHHSSSYSPTITITTPSPFVGMESSHEPLLWCKSQVGEMWARLMHRRCAVKSLLTLPTGNSRKRHGARAGEEEESDKEGAREKFEETWAFQGVTFDFLTFWLAVLSLSPEWLTQLSGLCTFIPSLSLRFGMFNDFSFPL